MEPSHDTGVRIVRSRVTIDNFNLPAQEISKLWAEQENYVDLLETKLRQASQQDQLLKSKLLNKNRKLANTNAQLEKLKVSRASELSHLENGWVCNKCYCQALNTKEICQFPSCTSSNLSPSNIRRVCTNCFTRNLKGGSLQKNPVKRTKKVEHLYCAERTDPGAAALYYLHRSTQCPLQT